MTPGVGHGPRAWWRELLLLTAVYLVYRTARIAVTGPYGRALRHAGRIVAMETAVARRQELRLHRAFVARPLLARLADLYYGTVHFAAPALALALLFWAFPARYRRWRNVFGWMLLLGVIVFAAYPVLPPRLLPAGGASGLAPPPIPHPPPWSWSADNPYAAMPSLHVAWAAWCTVALWRSAPRRLWRSALVAYPLVTLAVVVGMAYHYLLDGVGGLLTLGAAWAIEAGRSRLRGRGAPERSVTAPG